MRPQPCCFEFLLFAAWIVLPIAVGDQTIAQRPAAPAPSTDGGAKLERIDTKERLNGAQVSYVGESRTDGRVLLDANNGFFDRTDFHAAGPQPSPAWDAALIKQHFSHLVPHPGRTARARWHLWVANPGSIEITLASEGKPSSFAAQLEGPGGKISRSSLASSSATLRCSSRGRHRFTLLCDAKDSATRVHHIEIVRPQKTGTRVLRARWRPAAIHTQYQSSTCPNTRLWVFESQSVTESSSYSPMSTQFGYFGGSFASDGRAQGNINFSVWAANSKAKSAPPLASMPHLTATGNPRAEFGGFGHEGSGVKIRGWDPLDHHPKSIIQALRVDTADGHDLFTGYLFDQRLSRWVLFAQAKRPVKQGRGAVSDQPTHLRAASFCEIPGPPNVQRSGDVRRIIRRRGWFFGQDKLWHQVDRQTTRSGEPKNQFIRNRDGWFEMATGGMEHVVSVAENRNEAAPSLPEYLAPDLTQQLFEQPVEFGSRRVQQITSDSAMILYDLKRAGTNARGVIHYGPTDCLTFVRRELHGTERKGVSQEMLNAERTWAQASAATKLIDGSNSIRLDGLDAGTTYYYRILVVNDQGKCWDTTSGSFTTTP